MFFKKKKSTEKGIAGGGDSSMFGLTIDQLKSLMDLRGKDLIEQLSSPVYNGIEGLLEKLKVDGNKGLDSSNEQDFQQRRIAYGKNVIPAKSRKSFISLCWDVLHDKILLILIVCAFLSIGLSFYKPPDSGSYNDGSNLEWIDGIAILAAVLIVVLVTAANDWRKEQQFRSLQDKIEKDQQISVIRDNHIQQIPVADLLVGDLCFIKYGNLLPADGILVQSNDLKIDESSVTGETDLIRKGDDEDVSLLSGTQVMEGSGRMIVVGVGLNSQVGKIMSLIGVIEDGHRSKDEKPNKKNSKATKIQRCITGIIPNVSKKYTQFEDDSISTTDSHQHEPKFSTVNLPNNNNEEIANRIVSASELPEYIEEDKKKAANGSKQQSILREKLTTLTIYLGYVGMAGALLTLICLIIRYCIITYGIKKQNASGSDVGYFVSFLIQGVTIVVVLVPEGLPLTVTLALSYAVRRMMSDNNLVRHLDACETMGNATTICSDKTGTLTTNRMTVVQSFINGKYCEQLPKKEQINEELLPLLFESISVNTNYTSKIEKPTKDDDGLPKQIGNRTECALLDLVEKWSGSYEQIRQDIPANKLVKVYTFNSTRKMMSTIIQRNDGYRVYTKGASEMVLIKCKSMIAENNQLKELSEDEKHQITHNIIEKMANNALRTICIAYKNLGNEEQNWDNEEEIVNDLTCIGIVGIEDPVRKEVPQAIENCLRAGVVVRMITGDNVVTARSIALKCGILKPGHDFLVLDGKEFNNRIRDRAGKISQKKLDEIWPKLRVLARSSPHDKYNLVNGIIESRATQNREIVAVTGDGTNDGPALKRADVGFAMGIQGTEVAKQASDIIITDDNFSSIVRALIWGRNVYDCIAKFVQFQITAALASGIISIISAAVITTVPIRAIQMLWVNLIMDTLASIALATESPTEELLNRKPYGRTKSIISAIMIRNILGQALYQITIIFVILYAGQYFLDVESTIEKIQNDPRTVKEISKQFTLVFNAFVLMTLFNEINARKIHGERNVFNGLFKNPYFYGIWLFCFGAQIIIVTFGDRVFNCARLNIQQWAWCLLFGAGSLLWQQIILFVPIKPFGQCFSIIYRIYCPWCYKRQADRQTTMDSDSNQLQTSTIIQLNGVTLTTASL